MWPRAADEHFPIDIFSDRLGHQYEHECERGDRLAGQRAVSASPCTRTIMSTWGQSSNDSIPTAIHVSAALGVKRDLVPALEHLRDVLRAKEREVGSIVKTGRTHLMDAMPVTLGQPPRLSVGGRRLSTEAKTGLRGALCRVLKGTPSARASTPILNLSALSGQSSRTDRSTFTRVAISSRHVFAGHGCGVVRTAQGH